MASSPASDESARASTSATKPAEAPVDEVKPSHLELRPSSSKSPRASATDQSGDHLEHRITALRLTEPQVPGKSPADKIVDPVTYDVPNECLNKPQAMETPLSNETVNPFNREAAGECLKKPEASRSSPTDKPLNPFEAYHNDQLSGNAEEWSKKPQALRNSRADKPFNPLEIYFNDQLPENVARFYRIDYPTSQTRPDENGFETSHPEVFRDGKSDFKRSVREHLNWKSPYLSPFLSVFSCKSHANNWAHIWCENHEGFECQVYEIDPEKIDSFISLPSAARMASIQGDFDKDEHLIFLRIPQEAIMDKWPVPAFKNLPTRPEDCAPRDVLRQLDELGL